jgi:hypothetical protein
LQSGVTELFGASTTLLAGHLFIRLSPYRRYSVESLRSDRYALHVFGFSLPLYLAGAVLPNFFPDISTTWEWTKSVHAAMRANGIPAAAVYAIVFAPIAAVLDSIIILTLMSDDVALRTPGTIRQRMRLAAVGRYVRKSSDDALKTIYRATALRKRLMVNLKGGKVYIGEPPTSMLDPTLLRGFIRLIPFASGYRNKDTKQFLISNRYDEIGQNLTPVDPEKTTSEQNVDSEDPLRMDRYYLQILHDRKEVIDIEDLGFVISWSEVESISIFDENVSAFIHARSQP